jgi:hypothetical protein
MSEADCKCPVLLAAAEIERTVEIGLPLKRYDAGLLRTLIVGRMRAEHGCRGLNQYGACAWVDAAYAASNVGLDDDGVPLLRRPGKDTGQYL